MSAGRKALAEMMGVEARPRPQWTPSLVRRLRERKERKLFDEQLPDALDLLAASLEAGSPLGQSLEMVAREGPSPIAEEFERIVADTRLGLSLLDALDASAERVGSREWSWCVSAVKTQHEFGASLADLLRTVSEFIRWRAELAGEVEALTAEGRLSARILMGLPFLLVAYFAAVNPGYLGVLVVNPLGILMVLAAVTLMTVGSVWMRRVVRVEV